MAKKPNIRWRDKDNREMQRIVNNYNAKLRRLEKQNPDVTDFLPERMTMKELRSKIETRQDFNRELNSLSRFSRRGAEELVANEKGVTLTKYEVREMGIKTRIVNTRRSLERKQLDLDYTKGNMGQISSNNLRPKVFNFESKSKKDIEKIKESLDREVQANFKENLLEVYKERYIEAIDKYLPNEGQALKDYLDTLSLEEIYENSIRNPILSIAFTSDPQNEGDIVSYALAEWKSIE